MPKICKVGNCEKPSRCYGMCVMHASRFERHGDPNITKHRANGTAMQYLLEVVLPYQGDDCLTWPFNRAGRDQRAYINLSKQERSYVAPWICEQLYGPAPSPTHQAAHSCGAGHLGCVNPRHLRWASPSENRADSWVHGTMYKGEAQHMAKLKEADVPKIRALQGTMGYREIGERFGVSADVVGQVIRRRSWKWLD